MIAVDATWTVESACRDVDPVMFDNYRDDETATNRLIRHRLAKLICAECTVRAECIASHDRTDDGIWGGRLYLGRNDDRRSHTAVML